MKKIISIFIVLLLLSTAVVIADDDDDYEREDDHESDDHDNYERSSSRDYDDDEYERDYDDDDEYEYDDDYIWDTGDDFTADEIYTLINEPFEEIPEVPVTPLSTIEIDNFSNMRAFENLSSTIDDYLTNSGIVYASADIYLGYLSAVDKNDSNSSNQVAEFNNNIVEQRSNSKHSFLSRILSFYGLRGN